MKMTKVELYYYDQNGIIQYTEINVYDSLIDWILEDESSYFHLTAWHELNAILKPYLHSHEAWNFNGLYGLDSHDRKILKSIDVYSLRNRHLATINLID